MLQRVYCVPWAPAAYILMLKCQDNFEIITGNVLTETENHFNAGKMNCLSGASRLTCMVPWRRDRILQWNLLFHGISFQYLWCGVLCNVYRHFLPLFCLGWESCLVKTLKNFLMGSKLLLE